MKQKSKGYSLDFLSNIYDRLTLTENSKFRRNQIRLMDIHKGEKVLEVGCGTGILSILAKYAVGESGEVMGIDIAPKMIAKAQQKAAKDKLAIEFKVASVDALPYPADYFDLIISSLMFHHLPVAVKKSGLLEIYRVLNKKGRFFLCDFGSPRGYTIPFMYLMLVWMSATRYQLLGKLPALIRECDFNTIKLINKATFLEYYMINKY